MKNGNKTCRRFFGGMLGAQERWLNRMAAGGWRLVRCGQASYEFEPAEPGAVQYAVEYVAHKSPQGVQDYKAFLEEMGCCVFYKNINWHYSVGKVKLRPWAEKGGRVAARRTTLDKELLIVEKRNDGKPFVLHTTLEDRADLYREIAKPWLFFFGIFAGVGLLARMPLLAAVGLLALAPALFYGLEAARLGRAAKTCEESWEALREQEAKGRWLRAAVCAALCLALAVGAVLLLPGSGARSFSGSRLGWAEQTARDSWSARYRYFNGRCARKLAVGPEAGLLHVEVTTEAGALALTVEDAQGNVIWAEQALPTGSFDLVVAGPVTVRLQGEGHSGSFRLEW